MQVAGRYRVVRRGDHAVQERPPKSLLGGSSSLDIRILPYAHERMPLLLVNASRKQGMAVQRNRFRRRVRMAFLQILRSDVRHASLSGVVWVRPARGTRLNNRLTYAEIEGQLRLALSRWESR